MGISIFFPCIGEGKIPDDNNNANGKELCKSFSLIGPQCLVVDETAASVHAYVRNVEN